MPLESDDTKSRDNKIKAVSYTHLAESMPEERKVPTSTSEIIWYSTDSVSTLRSFSAFASKDSFDGVWNR